MARRVAMDRKTVRKWLGRYRAEGMAELLDRSARGRDVRPVDCGGTTQRVITLRRRRWTMARIAAELCGSRATVSRVFVREELNRLTALAPLPAPRRHEWKRPSARWESPLMGTDDHP
jgi:transposase